MQSATSPSALHPDWRAQLVQSGAIFDGDRVLRFGSLEREYQAAVRSDILVDLSHLSILRVQGEDAQTFLQGQTTNDIRQVNPDHSQLSAYCNPKGRMLAIFRVFQSAADYCLQLPADLAEPVLKRLRMFVLRAKVKIELADIQWPRLGVSGPNATQLLQQTLGTIPTAVDEVATINDFTVLRLPGPHARFEVLGELEQMLFLWRALATQALPAGPATWSWLDIQAGIPTVLPATVEEFVPQMTNLELVGGVSFTKGCYPGQEIVARMHYLGRLKQRMYLAQLTSPTTPHPGEKIFSPTSDQSVGMVLDAQATTLQNYDLLVVVQIDMAQSQPLHLQSPLGPQLSLQKLPYSV